MIYFVSGACNTTGCVTFPSTILTTDNCHMLNIQSLSNTPKSRPLSIITTDHRFQLKVNHLFLICPLSRAAACNPCLFFFVALNMPTGCRGGSKNHKHSPTKGTYKTRGHKSHPIYCWPTANAAHRKSHRIGARAFRFRTSSWYSAAYSAWDPPRGDMFSVVDFSIS